MSAEWQGIDWRECHRHHGYLCHAGNCNCRDPGAELGGADSGMASRLEARLGEEINGVSETLYRTGRAAAARLRELEAENTWLREKLEECAKVAGTARTEVERLRR